MEISNIDKCKAFDRILRLLFDKTQIDINGCWNWKTISKKGYGKLSINAHRFAYLLLKGDIENNNDIDHICRNRACTNPKHLRSITHKENTLCSDGISAINARKTHCKRGHLLSGNNLRIEKRGSRRCRKCEKDGRKKY